jgi:signal transduction histidine kinase
LYHDVSRVEAGKMSMVKSWFHIRSMIEDVIDTIASRAVLNGVKHSSLVTIKLRIQDERNCTKNAVKRGSDTIQNSSTNLRELVDNILDVSRVEAGKMSMVKSWFQDLTNSEPVSNHHRWQVLAYEIVDLKTLIDRS